ncbi:Nn.00g067520.m01.CDS01 [Neocucurbitaria sp. VM-36]
MSSNVLSVRDNNAQIKPTPSPEKEKPKSLEYHRQVLQSRMDSEQTQPYVSPSDEIMSPATQKLQAFKNKHTMKKSKPQTLFKKTSSKKIESAKGTAMFADIPKDNGSKGVGA